MYYDYRMQKNPPKIVNLQHIYVIMIIPALSSDHATPKKAS